MVDHARAALTGGVHACGGFVLPALPRGPDGLRTTIPIPMDTMVQGGMMRSESARTSDEDRPQ